MERDYMDRKETTMLLGKILEADRLSGMGKYWAKEVSIDPFKSKGIPKRVDYMQFVPAGQWSVSEIEKGIFVCYEIKSCREDLYSGNGLNFLGEKNYIVTTMECYKSLIPDLIDGKLDKHIQDNFPESSHYWGIMVAVPYMSEETDEFENPTLFDEATDKWVLKVVKPCRTGGRTRSITELLFCMLRSGH
jgi:hypothetical protein